MPLCEIRVPTYQRPALLQRALASLLSQTVSDWVALVMDDSPGREGQEVVDRLADARIRYLPNVKRKGCAGNLAKAFATAAYAGGAFACVLEDDNWYMPQFLEDNVRLLRECGHSILLRNQSVVRDGPPPLRQDALPDTTRGRIFKQGVVSVLELRASLFHCEGISNGGLFWSTAARSALDVGPEVQNSIMQEYCRSLAVLEPLFFASEPLAVFSWAQETLREPVGGRVYNRGRQSIYRWLLRVHGAEIIRVARAMAQAPGGAARVDAAVCDALALSQAPMGSWSVKGIAKGLAKLALVDDPLAEFWSRNSLKLSQH